MHRMMLLKEKAPRSIWLKCLCPSSIIAVRQADWNLAAKIKCFRPWIPQCILLRQMPERINHERVEAKHPERRAAFWITLARSALATARPG